jgi:hypothetical protein
LANRIGLGLLCGLTSLAALAIYLFGYGSQPLSLESFFWAAPMLCPLAFLVYLKSKIGGSAAQAILYTLSVVGAYAMIRSDCDRGNCNTQNPALIAGSAMVAGLHMICMLGILIYMGLGAWKPLRSR